MQSSGDLLKTKANSIEELKRKYQSLTPDQMLQLAQQERKSFMKEGNLPPHKTFAIINTNIVQTPKVITRYWGPALNGAEYKTIMYLIDKTFGYDKEEGDPIALSQMIKGTFKKDKDGNEIRIDWGVGIEKPALLDALNILEVLGLIQVVRRFKDNGEKDTSLYRVKVYEEYEEMKPEEKQDYMSNNPFVRVDSARKMYKEYKSLKISSKKK